jgi:filamentous hemagglutinin
VVSGKQVIADVGGDLKIESLQDSSRFEGKQQSSGGSITLSPAGVPIGGGLNAGQSKVNSNYQSVTEQSGIQAGTAASRSASRATPTSRAVSSPAPKPL